MLAKIRLLDRCCLTGSGGRGTSTGTLKVKNGNKKRKLEMKLLIGLTRVQGRTPMILR